MTDATEELSAIRKHILPNLQPEARVTSPQTSRYNCIAYAAGEDSRIWWPDLWDTYFWPSDCPRTATLAAFQAMFEKFGYRICPSGHAETDIEKIAIFHAFGKPTHAARQLSNGLWTSKLGESFDIIHTEACMEGSDYGTVAFYMSRARAKLADI